VINEEFINKTRAREEVPISEWSIGGNAIVHPSLNSSTGASRMVNTTIVLWCGGGRRKGSGQVISIYYRDTPLHLF